MPSITLYVDAVSNYGYMAMHLIKTHFPPSVQFKLVPVFLGGIMAGTGNRPPFAVPPKGAYMGHDAKRTCRRYGIPIRPEVPKNFPVKTLLAQRVQVAAGLALGDEKLQKVVEAFERGLWEDEIDVEQEGECVKILMKALGKEEAEKVLRLFKEDAEKVKEQLKKNTEEAIAKGAFGVPWMVVKGVDGKEDVVWGVDHLDLVAEMVGAPWPPTKAQL